MASEFEDLSETEANAFLYELFEINDGSMWWDTADWVTERAILNRLFKLGQERERGNNYERD